MLNTISSVYRRQGRDHISLLSAGIAFFLLLSIFPALVAIVAAFGLAGDPQLVLRLSSALGAVLPAQALNIIEEQLKEVVFDSESSLALRVVLGFLFALWSATRGTRSLILALTIIDGKERRMGILENLIVSLLLTLGGLVLIVISLGLIALLPLLINYLPISLTGKAVASVLRWPFLILLMIVATETLYRYALHKESIRWKLISPGSAAVAVLWISASLVFSFYTSNFANYNRTYGSIGAVIILLLWLYLTAYLVLLGAELNAEL